MLEENINKTLKTAEKITAKTKTPLTSEDVGIIKSITGNIIEVAGLDDIQVDEIVDCQGTKGLSINLTEDSVGIVLLGDPTHLQAGDKIKRTGNIASVPVGPTLLGRVVNALGEPIDDKGPIKGKESYYIEREAHPIMHRQSVSIPLQTGIKAVDAFTPIGRGQRELILGDRQTGKTAIALDTLINQKGNGVIGIYCAIGQRADAVARTIEDLRKYGVMDQCIVVVATGEESSGMQFLAPYAATAMGEYFMEKEGKDVICIYDNLTVHAQAYRQMSLFLRRPPGREAYPGDIFYIHSRLLERSTRLRPEHGGGSLTALPICETLAQNVSAYIPTNLISITDGQIFLSNSLFQKGMMPAMDVGISVSRVGGKAQLPAYRSVVGDLKISYAQFQELEAFSRFGTQLDEKTRQALTRGERVREILKQVQYNTLSAADQVVVILATTSGLFDSIKPEKVSAVEEVVLQAAHKELSKLCSRVNDGEKLSGKDKEQILQTARQAIEKAKI